LLSRSLSNANTREGESRIKIYAVLGDR